MIRSGIKPPAGRSGLGFFHNHNESVVVDEGEREMCHSHLGMSSSGKSMVYCECLALNPLSLLTY
jgi:hypothetical protein